MTFAERIRALIDARLTLWLKADTLEDVVAIHEVMDALRCAFRIALDEDIGDLEVHIAWMRRAPRRAAPRPHMIKAADELEALMREAR